MIRFRARNRVRVGAAPGGGRFGDDEAAFGDRLEQLSVRGRVGAVRAARHDRDGRAAGEEGAAVCGLVDAVGEAADDGVAHGGEVAAQLGCLFGAVVGGGAGSDDGHGVAGEPAGGLYDNELFEQGRGHLLLYRPTPEPPSRGRVRPVRLPAVELAVTVHEGEHDGVDVTYGQLGSWVVGNALTVAGPVRERYLVGPRDTEDSAAWRTEIGWPVFRVTEDLR